MNSNQQALFDKYIEYPDEQIVLDNDGFFITFYERDETNVVTLHQSDEFKDNFVCIHKDNLLQLNNMLKQVSNN